MVTGVEAGNGRSRIGHYAGNFVTQDDAGLHATTEDARHHQQVVVAKPAGGHLNQHLMRSRDRHGDIPDREDGRPAGLFEDQCAHD